MMNYFNRTADGNSYNRFVNLDNFEFRIIDYLAKSQNKHADFLFKMLKYDGEDCLYQPSLTYEERMKLFYSDNGDASDKRVFMSPYIDDAFVVQCSHLHVYIESVIPQNQVLSTVNIAVESIVHNKISNIYGDATLPNGEPNPSEVDKDGNPLIIYKSRAAEMLKCVLAELNGAFIAGVGMLQFNSQVAESKSKSELSLWNGRKFFGHKTVFATMVSGASNQFGDGY